MEDDYEKKDCVCLMANQRYYRYTKAGTDFLYYVNSKEEQKDIKRMVSALVANNVAIRLGLALKL